MSPPRNAQAGGNANKVYMRMVLQTTVLSQSLEEPTPQGDLPPPTTSQSRSSSAAPAEFHSDIAQALHLATANVGDQQDFDYWNKMCQHNLVLWLDYNEEATSYHTLDMPMRASVHYRCT